MLNTTSLSRERLRTISQSSFYLLFLCAPLLDIFRFDIIEGHFIIFGQSWMFGLEYSEFECLDTSHSVSTILLNFLLPLFVLVLLAGFIAWKYGRIYCGWLCPHFSVVETINRLMLKYLSRVTLWEKPAKQGRYSTPKLLIFIVWSTHCLYLVLCFISLYLSTQITHY